MISRYTSRLVAPIVIMSLAANSLSAEASPPVVHAARPDFTTQALAEALINFFGRPLIDRQIPADVMRREGGFLEISTPERDPIETLKTFSEDLRHELPSQEALWRTLAQYVNDSALMLPKLILRKLESGSLDKPILRLIKQERSKWQAMLNHGGRRVVDNHPHLQDKEIAYFSAEFGFKSLDIFSGGLGVLAGDTVRGASDEGLQLTGIGLFYKKGYFHQIITREGRQSKDEHYAGIDPENVALSPVRLAGSSEDLMVDVPLPGRAVKAKVWQATYGRSRLLLLDTNVDANSEHDRHITDELYHRQNGSPERLDQYAVLGAGGMLALQKMGINPDVLSLNDSHPFFAVVQAVALARNRIRREYPTASEELIFEAAFELVHSKTAFTTHTPVEAGNEKVKNLNELRKFLGSLLGDDYAVERLMSMGEMNGEFNITAFNLRASQQHNAVSELHGMVAKPMWKPLFPGINARDVPIPGIVNSVHVPYWQAPEIAALTSSRQASRVLAEYAAAPDRLYGELRHLVSTQGEEAALAWVDKTFPIKRQELWKIHLERKKMLLQEVRRRVAIRVQRGDAPPEEQAYVEGFDPLAFTIGFARRSAEYKRMGLLFRDLDRLIAIAVKTNKPIQILMAGKAHPQDGEGQNIIAYVNKRISELHVKPGLIRAVFIENYDIDMARYMVSGVDVWLNNPVRPQEASGTSGMKVGVNGGLNLSTRDGWVVEGIQDGVNGWLFGTVDGRNDFYDAEQLYHALETIAHLYYAEAPDGAPLIFTRMMKASLLTIVAQFGMHRMLEDYAEKIYLPIADKSVGVGQAYVHAQLRLAARDRLLKMFPQGFAPMKVEIGSYPAYLGTEGTVPVQAMVDLGPLDPEAVGVDLHIWRKGEEHIWQPMSISEDLKEGRWMYRADLDLPKRGDYHMEVRVTPQDMSHWRTIEERNRFTRTEPGPLVIHSDDKELLKYLSRSEYDGQLLYLHVPPGLIESVRWVSPVSAWGTAQGYRMQELAERPGWWAVVISEEDLQNSIGPNGRPNFKFYARLKDGRQKEFVGPYKTEDQTGYFNAYIDRQPNDTFYSRRNAHDRLNVIAFQEGVYATVRRLWSIWDRGESAQSLLDNLSKLSADSAKLFFGDEGMRLVMGAVSAFAPEWFQREGRAGIRPWDPRHFDWLDEISRRFAEESPILPILHFVTWFLGRAQGISENLLANRLEREKIVDYLSHLADRVGNREVFSAVITANADVRLFAGSMAGYTVLLAFDTVTGHINGGETATRIAGEDSFLRIFGTPGPVRVHPYDLGKSIGYPTQIIGPEGGWSLILRGGVQFLRLTYEVLAPNPSVSSPRGRPLTEAA